MRLLNVAAESTNWNPVTDKIRTFVDSGVLITAARGSGESANDALAILDDPDREFVSSFLSDSKSFPSHLTLIGKASSPSTTISSTLLQFGPIRRASLTMPFRLPANSDFRPWTRYILPQRYQPERQSLLPLSYLQNRFTECPILE